MTEKSEVSLCYPHRRFPAFCENVARQGFPTVEQFRRGITLNCIAHALWLAANEGLFAHNCQWEGDTYANDNDQGEQWAVSFRPEGAVAVFYSSESERNPFPQESPPYDQANYFRSMPDTLQTAKEHALAWMIDLDWQRGGPNAVITAAMWTDGERFTANEPWEEVFYQSLWACHRQLQPFEVAVIELQNQWDLNDEDVAVLVSLYHRRLAATEAMIAVEPREQKAFLRGRKVTGPNSQQDDPGFSAAHDALACVGIVLRINE